MDRTAALVAQGRADTSTLVEYTLTVYYTRQVRCVY